MPITQLQIIGIVVTIFGIAFFTLALRRKNLRRRILGLQKFTVGDRAPFSKGSELRMQQIGLIMALVGIIVITLSALKQSDNTVNDKRGEITRL